MSSRIAGKYTGGAAAAASGGGVSRRGPDSFTEVRYVPNRGGSGSRRASSSTGGGGGGSNLCCALVFGVILFTSAFPVLWWNEGNAVAVYDALKEAKDSVVQIKGGVATPSTKGSLVHVVGKTSGERLRDGDFGVAMNDAIRLDRVVESYQWKETKSERRVEEGDETRVETTYTYDLAWIRGTIDSSKFRRPNGHRNAGAPEYDAKSIAAREVGVGDGFVLRESLVNKLTRRQTVRLTPPNDDDGGDGDDEFESRRGGAPGRYGAKRKKKRPKALGGAVRDGADADADADAEDDVNAADDDAAGRKRRRGKGIVDDDDDDDDEFDAATSSGAVAPLGEARLVASSPPPGYAVLDGLAYSRAAAASNPKVGDRRVRYAALPGGQVVSVLAKQGKGGALVPFVAKSGKEIALVRDGRASYVEMIERATRANATRTWLVRAGGFLLMFFGVVLLTAPVRYAVGALRWIPLLGGFAASVINLGVFLAALAVAIALSLVVIGASWITHRPVIAIAMLASSVGVGWAARRAGDASRGGGDRTTTTTHLD